MFDGKFCFETFAIFCASFKIILGLRVIRGEKTKLENRYNMEVLPRKRHSGTEEGCHFSLPIVLIMKAKDQP